MHREDVIIWFRKNIIERPYWFIIDKSNGLIIDGSSRHNTESIQEKEAELLNTVQLLRSNFGVYQINLQETYNENCLSKKRSLTFSIPYLKPSEREQSNNKPEGFLLQDLACKETN